MVTRRCLHSLKVVARAMYSFLAFNSRLAFRSPGRVRSPGKFDSHQGEPSSPAEHSTESDGKRTWLCKLASGCMVILG